MSRMDKCCWCGFSPKDANVLSGKNLEKHLFGESGMAGESAIFCGDCHSRIHNLRGTQVCGKQSVDAKSAEGEIDPSSIPF